MYNEWMNKKKTLTEIKVNKNQEPFVCSPRKSTREDACQTYHNWQCTKLWKLVWHLEVINMYLVLQHVTGQRRLLCILLLYIFHNFKTNGQNVTAKIVFNDNTTFHPCRHLKQYNVRIWWCKSSHGVQSCIFYGVSKQSVWVFPFWPKHWLVWCT